MCWILYVYICIYLIKSPVKTFVIYYWLCWVFVAACGLSPVAASGDCSLVAVQGLLIAVASIAVEHRL